jgi:16S rRNA (cytosine1402-N4)-methyltransferase
VFQALRIAVNEELAAIEELLKGLPQIMDEDSWAAVISFHSLEDRLVKRYFRAWESGNMNPDQKRASEKQQWLEMQMGLVGQTSSANVSWGHEDPRGGATASEEEIKRNPRSRSARLRGFHFQRKFQTGN